MMKRFISALALCFSLLVLLSLFLFPPAEAKENVIMKLLNLPAPPPPNPLVKATRQRDQKFYDPNNPPNDNAPIEDLIDYWTNQGNNFSGTQYYNRRPSGRSLDRLMSEMAKKPELASQLLDVLPNDKSAVDAIKDLYDRAGSEGGVDREERKRLQEWLRFNSPYFSRDLERISQQIKDENNYVSQNNENNILALTRYDFDKASPIINQLYNDSSQPVSRALATWALYRHALETDSLSDIERYRGELMRMVEDRNLPEGVRDKANDGLMHERDFPGRDDWAFSLFEDETLVNITRFTMVTTLILRSPPEKYVPKMIALLQKTSNTTIRAATVRNLVTAMGRNPGQELEIEIIKSLLPWLEDAKWAADVSDSRSLIVRKLIEYQIPESVPGLINMLDEKEEKTSVKHAIEAGIMKLGLSGVEVSDSDGEVTLTGTVSKERLADVMKAAMEADVRRVNNRLSVTNGDPPVNVSRSVANSIKPAGPPVYSYPYRQSAIAALGKQKDSRAVPALRRVLNEINGYERSIAVKAILDCGGFTLLEQMAALESAAKQSIDQVALRVGANAVAYSPLYITVPGMPPRAIKEPEIKDLLGQQLMNADEISDELAGAIVDRIETLDEKNPSLAGAYRRMILKWQNAVINMLLLRDVKRDIADDDTIVRLLSQRKSLREQQSGDVADLRNGKATAVGIAACLFEDRADFETILENADAEKKTAMLACARLIRSPLPVAKVAENLKSQNPILQLAAERYLESEDSPEARGYVLARHPDEAMILGATSAFYVKDASNETSSYLWMLYQSLGNESLYNGWGNSYNDDELRTAERQLQAEVKRDNDLLGVYSYDSNFIRIYKDRVIFSWDEDDSRYRERPLTKYEFDEIRSYFTTSRVDELPPFLSCGGDYCSAKELVMIGRNGGRRVYLNGGSDTRNVPEFFAWLDKYFADLKLTKATLKYALSRDIPGLEILLASDDLHAETVWAQGNDIRVAASSISVRKKVEAEVENSDTDDKEPIGDSPIEAGPDYEKRAALLEKRRYEGFAWYKVSGGEAAGIAAQPPQAEYIPLRGSLTVQPSDEQWKARAGDVEIRASGDGLYKVVQGRLTKIHTGSYDNVVVTPNARWVAASRSTEDGGSGIVRVDIVTNREYPVVVEGYGQMYPVAHIPTLNKFLVVKNERYYDEGPYAPDEADAAPDDVSPAGLFLLDPATGIVGPIAGEFRPLSQQTFRPLQNASKPNEFWAAIYDTEKNETQVGIYDAKVFGFRPVLRIPKIKFNSMGMWVDEAAGKAYFVYRGHLLSLPMGKQN